MCIRACWLGILVITSLGCFRVDYRREPVPLQISQKGDLIDINFPTQEYQPIDPNTLVYLTETFRRGCTVQPVNYEEWAEGAKGKNLLAISGGGMFGAFSVGVLNGWTAAGNRPNFDMVTGVSTGSLIATFAFLGSEYDEQIRKFYTTVRSQDIFEERPRLALVFSNSYASSEPLKKLLDAIVDDKLLQAVAKCHKEGRRLFVGTTNLETRRFVIWDLGAIAVSGDVLLYRKVLLASSSVPGFFPPVPIDIEVNGNKFTELHCDGGVTSNAFIRLPLDSESLKKGKRPLIGSNLYVLTSGKYYADPHLVNDSISAIASSTISALLYSQTRNDLLKMYTMCLVSGMAFHVTAIPQDFMVSPDSLNFDPKEMTRLYEEGYKVGVTGQNWRTLPPGTGPTEQALPRTGTKFTLPTK